MKIKEIFDDLIKNTQLRDKTRFVVGTAIGVLAGSAADILLAPKSGRETRKDIKHRAEMCAENARIAARKTV